MSIAPPTPEQIASFRAELARGGLTPADLGRVKLRARVVKLKPTFSPADLPSNWGQSVADLSPTLASGCSHTRTSKAT